MKKIFLSLTLLLFAMAGFSQAGFKPVKIDSLVTVSFPAAVQEKDTLGQQIFSANGVYGYMITIRAANAKNNTPLKKEGDLNKVLKDFIKGIQTQSEGSSAQNVRDTTIGTLKAKVFRLKNDDGGGGTATYRNFILLYTQEATYTFEYVYPENRADIVAPELKAFTSSIKLSHELQRNDQYLSNAKGLSTVAKIGIFGGGALIVILIIVMVVKRKNKLAVN